MGNRKTKVRFFEWKEPSGADHIINFFSAHKNGDEDNSLQGQINAFLASDECEEVIDIKSGSFLLGEGKVPGASSGATYEAFEMGGLHFIMVHYYPKQ